VKCGGEYIGEKQEIILVLVAGLPGLFQTIEIRMGDPDKFGLPAMIWAHSGVAIGGVRLFGIHRQTSLSVASVTGEAIATCDIEGQNDSISLLNAFHGFAYFFDDAHDFMANYGPFVERGSPIVHVEIAAPNSARRDRPAKLHRTAI
jgi:hypothetical protein